MHDAGPALEGKGRREAAATVARERRRGGERVGDGIQARTRVLYSRRLMAAYILTLGFRPPQS